MKTIEYLPYSVVKAPYQTIARFALKRDAEVFHEQRCKESSGVYFVTFQMWREGKDIHPIEDAVDNNES